MDSVKADAGGDGAGGGAILQPGDLCHHGANALPMYRVIWIDDGRVWLRDVNTDVDTVAPLGRCRPCLEESGEGPGPTPVTWPDGTSRP
jgi:hypothetical protein